MVLVPIHCHDLSRTFKESEAEMLRLWRPFLLAGFAQELS